MVGEERRALQELRTIDDDDNDDDFGLNQYFSQQIVAARNALDRQDRGTGARKPCES